MNRSDLSSRRPGRRYLTVAQHLLSEMDANRLAIGARLPSDRELAGQYEVSRATVREALLALELIGVVEIRHGAGTYVRRPHTDLRGDDGSPLDAPPRELIESRQLIEPVVAGLVAGRVIDQTLSAVRRDLDEAAELVSEPGLLPRFITLGLRFHADLAPGCGNALLAKVVAQLVDVEAHPLWTLLNQQAMRTVAARQGQIDEHRVVLASIASHDEAAAEKAMRIHLDALNRAILNPGGLAHSTPARQSTS